MRAAAAHSAPFICTALTHRASVILREVPHEHVSTVHWCAYGSRYRAPTYLLSSGISCADHNRLSDYCSGSGAFCPHQNSGLLRCSDLDLQNLRSAWRRPLAIRLLPRFEHRRWACEHSAPGMLRGR
eukprot:7938229-Pyramimonas_sp.AAC.1